MKHKKPTILAIIPARGGSKRLPNKNIIDLNGRPLISYVITALKKAAVFDDIVVSSDSEKILKVAKKYGATTSKRPARLATDTARTIDVIINELKHQKKKYDYVLFSQPTSPLLNPKTVEMAIEKMLKHHYDCLFSVVPINTRPRYHLTISPDDKLRLFHHLSPAKGKQLIYQFNGALYLYKTKFLLTAETKKTALPLSPNNSGCIVMDELESIDIDTYNDLLMVKSILKTIYARQ